MSIKPPQSDAERQAEFDEFPAITNTDAEAELRVVEDNARYLDETVPTFYPVDRDLGV